jgi:hypothetical protein
MTVDILKGIGIIFHSMKPLVFVFALFLCACGGGDSIDVSRGQGSDPVVVDVSIAYVKRPVPLDNQGNVAISDVRELRTFDIGADLFVRDRASPSATEINITGAITQGLGAVKDLETSFDGEKILFAMRAQFIPNADEEDQPTWNIWQYDLVSDQLIRIIPSDITAEAGHDIAPHYLPDGRIIFSSTRQRQSRAILIDEGKLEQYPGLDEDRNEPAFVLHVMNEDGSDVHQVSFNQSHDLDPSVLSNGQVLFSRWDNMGGRNGIHLYRMNPDGTDLELLYGANSHDTGTNGATVQFLHPRELPDGSVMAIIKPFTVTDFGGDIIDVDIPNYIETIQPTVVNLGILNGPAQVAATINDVRTDGTISPGGVFADAYPLWDGTGRVFTSWSQCRLVEDPLVTPPVILPCTPSGLVDPAAVAAPPLFGIWMYDPGDNTQLPVLTPEEGFMYTDVVAAQVRTLPPVIYDKDVSGDVDPDLFAEGVGLLNIRSVYDVDGLDMANPDIPTLADPGQTTMAADRPARFLRIVKAVSIPDDDVRDFVGTAFGVGGAGQGMREIIGTIPIEPDGSVITKVPANVALAISVLDENGRRITPRHQNWLQLRPGTELKCNGCHENGTGFSHGRNDAFASAYAGATTVGPFPNTLTAIFADFGDTMAEARARLGCATNCASITPSVDVIYDDVWTDPAAAGRPADSPFAYLYDDLDTTAPTTTACQTAWGAACRTVINYETNIHPLWSVPRLAADGVTDATCTVCHSRADAMGVTQVPAGQLELTDGLDQQVTDHFNSYRELLAGDLVLESDGAGGLQLAQQQVGVDPVTGLPIFQPIPVGPSMSPAGANASPAFFNPFINDVDHIGLMTDAELRLISEWLDIGGQYFNNPFDAPLN